MEVAGKLQYSEDTTKASESDQDLYCDPCHGDGDTTPADGYCTECREYLCRVCIKHHRKFQISKDHAILENGHMPKSKPDDDKLHETEYCSIHVKTKEPIKFYCPSHNAFGCGDCIVMSHRTCKVEYIDDAARDFKDSSEYQEFMTSLESTEKKLEDVSKGLQNVKENNECKTNKAIDDIENFMCIINTQIDQKGKEIITEIERMHSDDEKVVREAFCQLDEKRQKIKDFKLQLQTRAERADQMFMYAKRNAYEIQKVKANLAEHEKKCKAIKKNIVFKCNTDLKDRLQSNTSLGELQTNVDVSKATIKREKDIDIKTKEDTIACYITGIVQYTPDTLVLADSNNKAVKVVNTSTSKVTPILKFPDFPRDLTVLDDCREIAVSLMNLEQIKILTVTDTTIQEVRTLDVRGNNRGLSYCNGNLAVIYYKPNKVEVMDTHGTVSSVIQDERIDGVDGYLVFEQNGKELFIKCKNDCVGRFTVKGEFLATYSDSKLKDIRAMAVTRDGQLLVCGTNSHNIHVVSQECKKLRVLLSVQDGLKCPLSLCLCEDTGTLYVGSGNNSLQVFELQQKNANC